ncbi:MAG: hypothetical protein GXP55_19945 [Deltaproteobacteria bacterium]|nr:hypothetical protein [Deltaproteobacteria bacterium]
MSGGRSLRTVLGSTPLLVGLLLSGCGWGSSTHGSVARVPDRTEVVFLPMLHGAHRGASGYSFGYLREILREIAPDVVLVEVPPSIMARVEAASDAHESGAPMNDPWLTRWPEIFEVLLPMRRRLHYQVVPVSGLSADARRDFRAYFEAHPLGPDVGYYRRALRAVRVMREDDDPREEPAYALSPAYRRLVGWPRQALSTAAEDELGEAGPRRLVHAHLEKMREAIAAHPGERIVVAFDAADAWYLVPRLRHLPGVHYIDALAFDDVM